MRQIAGIGQWAWARAKTEFIISPCWSAGPTSIPSQRCATLSDTSAQAPRRTHWPYVLPPPPRRASRRRTRPMIQDLGCRQNLSFARSDSGDGNDGGCWKSDGAAAATPASPLSRTGLHSPLAVDVRTQQRKRRQRRRQGKFARGSFVLPLAEPPERQIARTNGQTDGRRSSDLTQCRRNTAEAAERKMEEAKSGEERRAASGNGDERMHEYVAVCKPSAKTHVHARPRKQPLPHRLPTSTEIRPLIQREVSRFSPNLVRVSDIFLAELSGSLTSR